MKRDYTSGIATDITFFTGIEIEKTPAYGMKTLFVVGTHDPQTVLHIANDTQAYLDESKRIKHIYFGANQSFPKLEVNDVEGWRPWEYMIQECLDAGYWCTLDFDVAQVEGVIESALVEHKQFIPQISVKLPYLTQLGYNATIKLDDLDFDHSNPGVWCHRLRDLTTTESFTDWDQYGKDEIIK
jgi:hypothetical protein